MKYFEESEFNDFKKLGKESLYKLDKTRALANNPIHIHSDFRENSERHASGKAFDIHISEMNIIDQYFLAERMSWKGIGLYPCWNNPGIHIDDYKPGRWISYYDGTGRQIYVALNWENFSRYIIPTIKL